MTPDEQERHENTWITQETIRTRNGHYQIRTLVEQRDGQWKPQWQPMRRWRYTSQPPADLPIQPINTIRNTGNTVLITQNGDAVILGPKDRVSVQLTPTPAGAAPIWKIRLDSDPMPDMRDPLNFTPPDNAFEWTSYEHGMLKGVPRSANGRPVTRLLYANSKGQPVTLGPGELLPTSPVAGSAGALRIGDGDLAVTIPANAVQALGMNQPLTPSEMRPHTGPIFAAGGAKKADVRPGTGPCNAELIDNLEQIADKNPEELDETFHEYKDPTTGKHDGTVGVRFFVDATPHWIHVNRNLLHQPGNPTPIHIDHTDGQAMWAPLLYKAYEILRHKIKNGATVSLRPFSPPIDPTTLPPPAPMPRTRVQAPTDRWSIVDTQGDLLSAKLGEVVAGTPDPQNPNIYWLHVELDGNATPDPPQPVHRSQLNALYIGSNGEYRCTITSAALGFLGWVEGGIPTRLLPGRQLKLGLNSRGLGILGNGNTLITESAMEALGRTVLHPAKDAKIFHDSDSDGKPHAAPRDVIQGGAPDCGYLAPLASIAANNPRTPPAMLYQYPNGTIVIRFNDMDYNPRWRPITTHLWADANRIPLYAFYDHKDNGKNTPMWPALFEKALATECGGDYMNTRTNTARALETLLPPYKVDDFGSIHQPTNAVALYSFLHPMSFGVDTLHDLLCELLGGKADRKFAERLYGLVKEFHEEVYNSVLADTLLFDTLFDFDEFLRKYLHPDELGRWSAEIKALLGYLDDIHDPDKPFTSKIAREHVTDFIRYLLDSGDTIVVGTQPFGHDMENFTQYPGLVGHHAYSVFDMKRGEGGQVTLRLRNPWGHNPNEPRAHPLYDRTNGLPNIGGVTYGADGTLSVDIKHLNKFRVQFSHGTGTRFALGAPDPTQPWARNAFQTATTTTPEEHESLQSPDSEYPQPPDTTTSAHHQTPEDNPAPQTDSEPSETVDTAGGHYLGTAIDIPDIMDQDDPGDVMDPAPDNTPDRNTAGPMDGVNFQHSPQLPGSREDHLGGDLTSRFDEQTETFGFGEFGEFGWNPNAFAHSSDLPPDIDFNDLDTPSRFFSPETPSDTGFLPPSRGTSDVRDQQTEPMPIDRPEESPTPAPEATQTPTPPNRTVDPQLLNQRNEQNTITFNFNTLPQPGDADFPPAPAPDAINTHTLDPASAQHDPTDDEHNRTPTTRGTTARASASADQRPNTKPRRRTHPKKRRTHQKLPRSRPGAQPGEHARILPRNFFNLTERLALLFRGHYWDRTLAEVAKLINDHPAIAQRINTGQRKPMTAKNLSAYLGEIKRKGTSVAGEAYPDEWPGPFGWALKIGALPGESAHANLKSPTLEQAEELYALLSINTFRFTDLELEILVHRADNRSSIEIAQIIGCTLETLKRQENSIHDKANNTDRQHGWIDLASWARDQKHLTKADENWIKNLRSANRPLSDLLTDTHKKILLLHKRTPQDISKLTGIAVRTVNEVLDLIRDIATETETEGAPTDLVAWALEQGLLTQHDNSLLDSVTSNSQETANSFRRPRGTRQDAALNNQRRIETRKQILVRLKQTNDLIQVAVQVGITLTTLVKYLGEIREDARKKNAPPATQADNAELVKWTLQDEQLTDDEQARIINLPSADKELSTLLADTEKGMLLLVEDNADWTDSTIGGTLGIAPVTVPIYWTYMRTATGQLGTTTPPELAECARRKGLLTNRDKQRLFPEGLPHPANAQAPPSTLTPHQKTVLKIGYRHHKPAAIAQALRRLGGRYTDYAAVQVTTTTLNPVRVKMNLKGQPAPALAAWALANGELDNNKCAPNTANYLAPHFHNAVTPVRPEEEAALGAAGMPGPRYQYHLGGPLQQLNTEHHNADTTQHEDAAAATERISSTFGYIKQQLRNLIQQPNRPLPLHQQPMAAVLVTYRGHENAGAHTFVLRHDGNHVMVHDKAISGTDFPVELIDHNQIATISFRLYNPHTHDSHDIPHLPTADISNLRIRGTPTPGTDPSAPTTPTALAARVQVVENPNEFVTQFAGANYPHGTIITSSRTLPSDPAVVVTVTDHGDTVLVRRDLFGRDAQYFGVDRSRTVELLTTFFANGRFTGPIVVRPPGPDTSDPVVSMTSEELAERLKRRDLLPDTRIRFSDRTAVLRDDNLDVQIDTRPGTIDLVDRASFVADLTAGKLGDAQVTHPTPENWQPIHHIVPITAGPQPLYPVYERHGGLFVDPDEERAHLHRRRMHSLLALIARVQNTSPDRLGQEVATRLQFDMSRFGDLITDLITDDVLDGEQARRNIHPAPASHHFTAEDLMAQDTVALIYGPTGELVHGATATQSAAANQPGDAARPSVADSDLAAERDRRTREELLMYEISELNRGRMTNSLSRNYPGLPFSLPQIVRVASINFVYIAPGRSRYHFLPRSATGQPVLFVRSNDDGTLDTAILPETDPGPTGPGPGHQGRHRDGALEFRSQAEGARFAYNHLRAWPQLTTQVQIALDALQDMPHIINTAMRETRGTNIGWWVELSREACERTERHTTDGLDEQLEAEHDALAAITDPTAQQQEQLAMIRIRRYAQRADSLTALNYRTMVQVYREHLGSSWPTGPPPLREHINLLREATSPPLPLTENIRVTVPLEHTNHLITNDNTPLRGRDPRLLAGTRQHEPGFTLALVGTGTHGFDHYIELVLPPGTRGVYIGSDGRAPHDQHNTLVLAPGLHYTINRVTQEPDLTDEHGQTIPGQIIIHAHAVPDLDNPTTLAANTTPQTPATIEDWERNLVDNGLQAAVLETHNVLLEELRAHDHPLRTPGIVYHWHDGTHPHTAVVTHNQDFRIDDRDDEVTLDDLASILDTATGQYFY
ncbi:MAG: hypothetical protein J2P17_01430, partial [Mycobacterium sp.]|nr:hypothetical protein [Mycobacterium sp.]